MVFVKKNDPFTKMMKAVREVYSQRILPKNWVEKLNASVLKRRLEHRKEVRDLFGGL